MTLAKVRLVLFPVLLCARSLISLLFLVSLVQEQHTGAASRHKGSTDNPGGPAVRGNTLLPKEQTSAKVLKNHKNPSGQLWLGEAVPL